MNQTNTQYPPNTSWHAYVKVDNGRYFTVESRYPKAATRNEAIQKLQDGLMPHEHLNGVSLIPAKEWLELNKS